MKKNSVFYFLIASTLLFTSCGQISKEIAKDTLSGQYKGQATYHFRYSELNIGIDDKQESEKCFAMVFADAKSPSIVLTSVSDGVPKNIDISGIQFLINGASFNIPQQIIKEKETPINIQGSPTFTDTDGKKSDGAIDDHDNLSFTYEGIILVNDGGVEYNLHFYASYELKKLPLEKK